MVQKILNTFKDFKVLLLDSIDDVFAIIMGIHDPKVGMIALAVTAWVVCHELSKTQIERRF